MSLDVLGRPESPRTSGGVKQVLVIAAAALSVFVTGTAYATYQHFAPHGHDPEEALPVDAYAFAKVDLDPSVDQKLAIYRISKRFPELGVKSEDSLTDDLLRKVFDSADVDVDYDTEIKPWVGKRIGIAAVPGDSAPHVAVAIQVTDVDAAVAAIRKDAEDDVFVRASQVDDYVVLSDDEDTVARITKAGRGLDQNDDYRRAVDSLSGDAVITGWADLKRSFADLPEELAGGSLFDEADVSVSGQAVVAVRATGDALELETKLIGLKTGEALQPFALGGGKTTGIIQRFPKDAAVAVSATGLGDALATLYTQQRKVLDDLDGEGLLDALADNGVKLPADLRTLFGKEVAAFVSGTADEPIVAVRVEGTDGAAAKRVAQSLTTVFAGDGADSTFVDETFRTDGKGFTFGFPRDELGRITKGSLGSTPAFREAVPDAGKASFVLYVDIQRANTLMELDLGDQAKHLKAFGLTSTTDGDVSTSRMRLTFR